MENSEYLTEEALALLHQLVAIQAYSRAENARADFLEKYLTDKGCKVRRIGNNLASEAQAYDPLKPTVLLNSHIDTVPASEGWSFPPFCLTRSEQTLTDGRSETRLYGLGCNDAGAPLTCLIQTFLCLKQKALPYNLILGLSCEEEVTGQGGIDLLLPQLPPIDFALVGEPTAMRAAIAEKGLMVLDCTAHGTTGHAAHDTGDNAIYKAMKAIDWFRTTRIDDSQAPTLSGRPSESLLGPVKMTVTLIEAGTKHNVIPDTCRFTVDIRVNDRYDNQTLCHYIQEQLSPMDCTAEARSFRLASSGIDADHPAARRCRELGIGCFGSPTLSDQARMNFPSIKMGPGDSKRSHTADEYIRPSEIRQGVEGYLAFLDGLVLHKN